VSSAPWLLSASYISHRSNLGSTTTFERWKDWRGSAPRQHAMLLLVFPRGFYSCSTGKWDSRSWARFAAGIGINCPSDYWLDPSITSTITKFFSLQPIWHLLINYRQLWTCREPNDGKLLLRKNGVEYGMCISVNQDFLINMEHALAKHESVWLDLCMLNMQLKSWENIFSRWLASHTMKWSEDTICRCLQRNIKVIRLFVLMLDLLLLCMSG
jgi:hypothetical protein